MKEEEKKIIRKEEFIKTIAKRARFTQGDTKIMWDTIEAYIKEIIKNEDILKLSGFFDVSVTDVAEHRGYNAVEKKEIIVKGSKRIVFSASRALLKMFKEDKTE